MGMSLGSSSSNILGADGTLLGSAAWQKSEADRRYMISHTISEATNIRGQLELQQGRDYADRGMKVELQGESDPYLRTLAVSASAPGILVDSVQSRSERAAVSHSPARWKQMSRFAESHSSSNGNTTSGGGAFDAAAMSSPFKGAVKQLQRALEMEGEGTMTHERSANNAGMNMSGINDANTHSDGDGDGDGEGTGSAPGSGTGLPWRVAALQKNGSLEHLLHE